MPGFLYQIGRNREESKTAERQRESVFERQSIGGREG
jgi:hypothetical protein